MSESIHQYSGNAELYLLCNCEKNYSELYTEKSVLSSVIDGRRNNNIRVNQSLLTQRDNADVSNAQRVNFIKIDYFLSHLDEYV